MWLERRRQDSLLEGVRRRLENMIVRTTSLSARIEASRPFASVEAAQC
jgi:hypothetical protein